MAIQQKLISPNNPFRDMETPTHLRRGRKDFLCRLFDLISSASENGIMLSADDCCFALNKFQRGHERQATPRIMGKHLRFLYATGVFERFEFRSKEVSGVWRKKAFYLAGSDRGKWHRPDFPEYFRYQEDGQWKVTGKNPLEERDIKEQ